MRKLKAGVVDPSTVPNDELGGYLATTYAGYPGEVQNRLWELDQALCGPSFISRRFQKEVWSIQLRICIELLCFAVVDFDQVRNGLIGAKQRSKIDLDGILNKRKDDLVWPISFPSNWETDLSAIMNWTAPFCGYAPANKVAILARPSKSSPSPRISDLCTMPLQEMASKW